MTSKLERLNNPQYKVTLYLSQDELTTLKHLTANEFTIPADLGKRYPSSWDEVKRDKATKLLISLYDAVTRGV